MLEHVDKESDNLAVWAVDLLRLCISAAPDDIFNYDAIPMIVKQFACAIEKQQGSTTVAFLQGKSRRSVKIGRRSII